MPLITSIKITPCSEKFGFAHVVCNQGWSIGGIQVSEGKVTWPRQAAKDGNTYTVVTPPPEIRDKLERLILKKYRTLIGVRGERTNGKRR
jgi:hypothetical protein